MAQRPNTKQDVYAKIDKTEGCWLWTGSLTDGGYGKVRYEGRIWAVHRLVYLWERGPVAEGLHLDHVVDRGCSNRHCCNPAHLEPVTPKINTQRGRNHKRNQTHCIHGHKFTEENTYIKPNGTRMCRRCRVAAVRRAREKGEHKNEQRNP